MRTETTLRDALSNLADQAPAPGPVLARLQLGRPAPVRRRPRRVIIAVACLALVLIIGIGARLERDVDAPADRVPGHWGFVHQVRVPAGWMITERAVLPETEVDTLRHRDANGAADVDGPICQIGVYGRGAGPGPGSTGSETVRIGLRLGVRVISTEDSTVKVWWLYGTDAWAVASCPDGNDSLTMARSVRFVPESLTLPFSLTERPAGFAVSAVGWRGLEPPVFPYLQFQTAGGDGLLTVTSALLDTAAPSTGAEKLTVNGLQATLRRDQQTLCLFPDPPSGQSDQARQVCIERADGTPADPNSAWPTGVRAQLIELAQSMTLAPNLADPATWFDAEQAVP